MHALHIVRRHFGVKFANLNRRCYALLINFMPLPLLCIRHKQNNFFSLKRNKNQDNDEDADDDEERRGILYD